jgi:hypothetical protein
MAAVKVSHAIRSKQTAPMMKRMLEKQCSERMLDRQKEWMCVRANGGVDVEFLKSFEESSR